jgi:long-subunit fatty acid transport protein
MFESDVDDYLDTDTDGLRLHLGYGLIVEDIWSIGYSLTYFDTEEDSLATDFEMDDGFRHTLGVQVEAARYCFMGLSIFFASADPESEILTVGDLDGDADSWGFDLGAAWQLAEKTTLATSFDYANYSTDVDLPAGIVIPGPGTAFTGDKDEDGDSWAVKAGIEHAFTYCFDGRAGLRYQNIDYDFDNVGFVNNVDLSDELSGDIGYIAGALGFGIHFTENITLDYGFEYRDVGEGDMSHALSLVYRF